jgi:nucleoid-associated protein YgaU
VTRELKLALIVGFALVLVVTVLISDHLSHARQAELAGNTPAEPIKVAEPPAIALGNDLATPAGTQLAESAAADAPSAALAATQTSRSPVGFVPLTDPAGSPATSPTAGMTGSDVATTIIQGRGGAAAAAVPGDPNEALINDITRLGHTVRDNTIFVGPPAAKVVQEIAPGGPIPSATTIQPPKTVNANPPVATTPDRVHTVAAGESVFKIAKQYYGDGKAWRKLAKYNHLDEDAQVRAGDKLNIPSAEVLLGKKPTATAATPTSVTAVPVVNLRGNNNVTILNSGARPGSVGTATPVVAVKTHSYTVKKGDTLADIAKHELGSSKRAHEIVELNKKTIHDPDNLPLGAVLTLPAA